MTSQCPPLKHAAAATCVLLSCAVMCRHGDFVSRYKILLPREQQDIVLASEQQTRAAVLHLLSVFKVPDGQYEMGRTKVFFKPGGWLWAAGGCMFLHTVHRCNTGTAKCAAALKLVPVPCLQVPARSNLWWCEIASVYPECYLTLLRFCNPFLAVSAALFRCAGLCGGHLGQDAHQRA